MIRHAVLMGDPSHFSIKGGSNPHTRGLFLHKKRVSIQKAKEQWSTLKNTLEELGIHVFIMPAIKHAPGMVFTANAGVVLDKDKTVGKRVLLSNLVPTRAHERAFYKDFFEQQRFEICSIKHRFEGEADFFQAAGRYIFTHGKIREQKLKMRFKLPFLYREYGFRTDYKALAEIRQYLQGKEIISLELCDERFYHGDTVMCSFGSQDSYTFVYPKGISPGSFNKLQALSDCELILLNDKDAMHFIANSFYIESENRKALIVPCAIGDRLREKIKDCGITPIPIDVSEFLSKGGGSIKCLILDLGLYDFDA